MLQVGEGHLPEVTPPLAVWPISGNDTRTREFRERLQTSSSRHRDRTPHNPTTPFAKGGLAGVLNTDLNPVSGPIEEVVKFLAHLRTKSYQYRLLNRYTCRLAIASMHIHVDKCQSCKIP